MPDIIPRSAWSQLDPRRIELTTPKRLFLHHTVGGAGIPDRNEDGDSGDDYLRIVERVHILSNGWDDVAYNFFIDPVGLEIYEGQGWGREPNAQKGFNRGTWAVAVIGDFRTRHPDDYPGLLERIAELVAYGIEIGELPDVPLEGHRDAPGLSSYICPGPNLYSALPEINRLIGDDMADPKKPLESWAVDAFAWAIDKGFYTNADTVQAVREPDAMQRTIVFLHRYHRKVVLRAISAGGVTAAAVIAEIVARLGG